jgi:hypothetical protein
MEEKLKSNMDYNEDEVSEGLSLGGCLLLTVVMVTVMGLVGTLILQHL